MHRLNRIIALILTFLLILTVPISAAAGLDNFTVSKTFTGFSDVSESSWYYQDVRTVCELGLMQGKGADIFDPDGQLTNAEVFTLAARLHSIYNTGKSEFKSSTPWYQVYADYVKKNICDTKDFDPDSPATRIGYASILAKALPATALPAINRVDDGAIPDVTSSDEVYLLYRAGILTGSDQLGSFLPDTGIKRSEAAAIIARMADTSLRKSITLINENNDYSDYKNAFNASDWGDPKHICTSLYTDNSIDFRIDGNRLKVSGKIICDNLISLWIRCGENGDPFDAASGEYFEFECDIEMNGESTTEVTVYTQVEGDIYYWSYIWNTIYIDSTADGYVFKKSPVLENNIAKQSEPRNPADYLGSYISDEIMQKSAEIVGSETDDYKKLLLIHNWVAENIYYDWDYYTGRSSSIYWGAEDVLRERRSVCEGYARLTRALVQAQGIPCMLVTTFATGVSTSGGFFDSSNAMQTKSNHAHIEAYVSGRWVTVDPTWDSGNKYENGQFIAGERTLVYFDITPDLFAFTHKILER